MAPPKPSKTERYIQAKTELEATLDRAVQAFERTTGARVDRLLLTHNAQGAALISAHVK